MSRGTQSSRSHDQWIQRVNRPVSNVVESRGTIIETGHEVHYYTTHPAAQQWVALGVIPLRPGSDAADSMHRMVVGTGKTEAASISSLRERLGAILATSPAPQLVGSFHSASQASDWFG